MRPDRNGVKSRFCRGVGYQFVTAMHSASKKMRPVIAYRPIKMCVCCFGRDGRYGIAVVLPSKTWRGAVMTGCLVLGSAGFWLQTCFKTTPVSNQKRNVSWWESADWCGKRHSLLQICHKNAQSMKVGLVMRRRMLPDWQGFACIAAWKMRQMLHCNNKSGL